MGYPQSPVNDPNQSLLAAIASGLTSPHLALGGGELGSWHHGDFGRSLLEHSAHQEPWLRASGQQCRAGKRVQPLFCKGRAGVGLRLQVLPSPRPLGSKNVMRTPEWSRTCSIAPVLILVFPHCLLGSRVPCPQHSQPALLLPLS